MEGQGTRLLVGLGNPTARYDWTPHNLGFHVLDRLAAREGWIFESAARLDGDHGLRKFVFARANARALLVKPQTFMNLSGEAVAPLARHLGVLPESILVVYDDLDLPLGALRIRPHGGSGGHNGMKSIAEALGTERFPRLRVGIGRPRTDAARYVLEPFSPEGRIEAEISVANAADFCLDWVRGEELERAMTRYHSRWNQDAG